MPAAAPNNEPQEQAAEAQQAAPHQQQAPRAPQAAPQQAQASSDKSPFISARDWVLDTGTSVATGIRSTEDQVRNALRYQVCEQEEVNLLASPFYMAGNALDATLMNATRRVVDAVEPIGNATEAAIKGTLGAALQPICTIMHPVEYLKKPAKIGTSGLKLTSNIAKSPMRAIHDFMERGIDRNMQILTTKFRKFPLIGRIVGGIFGKTAGFLSKMGTKLTGGLSKFQDWCLSPFDKLDDAVKV